MNLDDCGDGPLGLISSDPDFTVQMDGTIQAVLVTMIPEEGRSFWITVHDRKGHRWFVDVILSPPGQVMHNIHATVFTLIQIYSKQMEHGWT